MQTELLIAILTGLGGMLGWGLADFFAKKTIDRVGAIVSLVWGHLYGTLALALVVLLNIVVFKSDAVLPDSMGQWLGIAFFGALQAVVYWLAYEGFGKGQLAILNPVFASYSGLAAFISIFVFGESVSVLLLVALATIFGGVVLASFDIGSIGSKRLFASGAPGLKEIVLAMVMAAFWQLYWDKFLGDSDWILYTMLMYLFLTITALVISKIYKVALSIKKPGLRKFLVLIGLSEAVAYLSLSLGFTATSFTSVVIVLAGAFSVPTIILARVFLKEKVTTIQTIGSLVIILGIVFLSIS